MPSVWGRLAARAVALLALAARHASSLPTDPSPSSDLSLGSAASENAAYPATWTDPVPGTRALPGLYNGTLDLRKRDCLANGSNYCFGNNVDYCPDCGNCCLDGNHCCGRGKVCCGSGCCPSDHTCFQGKCLSSAPVTVTSTVVQTVTRIATQRATILIARIERSTAVLTVDVTVSSAATQTNVIWVTATALAKRTAASPVLQLSEWDDGRVDPGLLETRELGQSAPTGRTLLHLPKKAAPLPRQASPGAAPTVTKYVTQSTDVTSTSSVIVTAHTTSTLVTTVFQTNIRVLTAQTTIDVTSTITITIHQPYTQTIVTTTTLIPPKTATPFDLPPSSPPPPTPTPTPPRDSGSPLPTTTIAGLAAGSSILGLLLAGLVILSFRRRALTRRSRRGSHSTSDTSSPQSPLDYHPPKPVYHYQYKRAAAAAAAAALPHFVPATPPHHAVQFEPPPSRFLAAPAPAAGQGRG